MLYHGSLLDVLPSLDADSFTACVTDPPYEFGFMGKQWDKSGAAFNPATWIEILRVLKPGGHLLAFGGSRTFHRIACAIEDAGFEIRDTVMWLYGSGFPKSLNVSKEMDKRRFGSGQAAEFKTALAEAVRASGKTRQQINDECGFTMRFDISYEKDPGCWGSSLPTVEQYDTICRVLGMDGVGETSLETLRKWPRTRLEKLYKIIGYEERSNSPNGIVSAGREATTIQREITAPGSEEAQLWHGYGTALKPAFEPIIVARKPLAGTVAANCLEHGCGALNIDGCRVPTDDAVEDRDGEATADKRYSADGSTDFAATPGKRRRRPSGSGNRTGGGIYAQDEWTRTKMRNGGNVTPDSGRWPANVIHDGSEEVLQSFPNTESGKPCGIKAGGKLNVFGEYAGGIPVTGFGDAGSAARFFYCAKASKSDRGEGNTHPTVKPLALMSYLVKLVTMPGENRILDPFAGSGTTLLACDNAGIECVGVELEAEHVAIINARRAKNDKSQPLLRKTA